MGTLSLEARVRNKLNHGFKLEKWTWRFLLSFFFVFLTVLEDWRLGEFS